MTAKYDPYEEFANAVILTAVKDWRDAMKVLKRGRKNAKAESMRKECEDFFRSSTFKVFTQLDGEMLLKRLESEVVK